jgi:hypothetical protein
MTGIRVSCPTCGASIPWTPASPWRPFCSKRCRLIDLGEWLDESRRIPDAADKDPDGSGDKPPEAWEEEPHGNTRPRSN